MDAAPNNPIRGRATVKKTGSTSRRVWTTKEEQVLLSALKELVNKGWKTDNGLRMGLSSQARRCIEIGLSTNRFSA
ncbi:hypothetical protein ACS0TY_006646 [Phlomoides rotata]